MWGSWRERRGKILKTIFTGSGAELRWFHSCQIIYNEQHTFIKGEDHEKNRKKQPINYLVNWSLSFSKRE
jgi:hypothetical protein